MQFLRLKSFILILTMSLVGICPSFGQAQSIALCERVLLSDSSAASAQVAAKKLSFLQKTKAKLQSLLGTPAYEPEPFGPGDLFYTEDPVKKQKAEELSRRLEVGDVSAWKEYLILLSQGGYSFKPASLFADNFQKLSPEVQDQLLHLLVRLRRHAKTIKSLKIKTVDGKRLLDFFFNHTFHPDLIFKQTLDETGSSFEAYRAYMEAVAKYYETPYTYIDAIEVARIYQSVMKKYRGDWELRTVSPGDDAVDGYSTMHVTLSLGGSFFNGRADQTSDIDSGGLYLKDEELAEIQSKINDYFQQQNKWRKTNLNFQVEHHPHPTIGNYFFGKSSPVTLIIQPNGIYFRVFEAGEASYGGEILSGAHITEKLAN